eukprot:7550744-Alexandrium_andersonii.AAC.1
MWRQRSGSWPSRHHETGAASPQTFTSRCSSFGSGDATALPASGKVSRELPLCDPASLLRW